MDTSNLTWRDKLAIIDTTARIAACMFLMMAAFCELLIVANG
ncbi:MAG: hypothetical protein U0Q11_10310 [Vicinamibacterales bacterium]